MNKIQRIENLYTKATWLFIAMLFLYLAFIDIKYSVLTSDKRLFVFQVIFIIIVSILNLVKQKYLIKELSECNKYYLISKFIELFLLFFGIIIIGIGQWAYVFSAIIIMIVSFTKGKKLSFFLILSFFPINLFLFVLYNVGLKPEKHYLFQDFGVPYIIGGVIFYIIAYFTIILMFGEIHDEAEEKENENKRLLEQLGEKYEQLAAAQDEIKLHYDKLKDTNIVLEETNKKLTSSIAEFYTLQQISQAISSILDIKELLKYVNDIILGVMGVNYSTIILYDEKRMKLKVHTTNTKSREDLITLNDNINCPILLNSLENSKPLLENFVDSDEYEFTQGREVNSLICVPLNTKTRKYGLVLIEHKYYSAFDEENMRLLETIGQQVGIAMENAELYQKMQELATIDGLTGIFNRLYFQERLQKEFKASQVENYPLSLAIFDIDHFKRFNDTFGHLFGDKVLKNISELVKNSLRNSDVFARYGGEEFIILFPRTSLKEANEKVEMLRQKISQTFVKDNLVTASVTVSFGIAAFPEFASTESELIRRADDALYAAKEAGRNCVMLASAE